MIIRMEKIDRRVRRTRKLLGDALIELALEKDFEAITIQEITDRADIGYRTFFRHYADKEALLLDVLRNIREEMRQFILPPSLDQILQNPGAALLEQGQYFQHKQFFEHVQTHHKLYRVLLFGNRNLLQPMKLFAMQEFRANFSPPFKMPIPFEIVINHVISSILALVRWWLEADMPYNPEEMGEYAYQLIIEPVRDLVLQTIDKIEKPT